MLTEETYEAIRSKILQKLEANLATDLYYHCVQHTVDVEMQAERIALNENVTREEDFLLLKIACLYHDTGFLFTYNEHEGAGCKLVIKELTPFGLTSKQLDIICGLVTATKIPQLPQTKLEEIICDADLDYLGRDDFFPISNTLFLELKARNFVATENDWNLIQVKFFKQHHYFTGTTINLRSEQKQRHLEIIEGMLVSV